MSGLLTAVVQKFDLFPYTDLATCNLVERIDRLRWFSVGSSGATCPGSCRRHLEGALLLSRVGASNLLFSPKAPAGSLSTMEKEASVDTPALFPISGEKLLFLLLCASPQPPFPFIPG